LFVINQKVSYVWRTHRDLLIKFQVLSLNFLVEIVGIDFMNTLFQKCNFIEVKWFNFLMHKIDVDWVFNFVYKSNDCNFEFLIFEKEDFEWSNL
jgi:hypothetical protein